MASRLCQLLWSDRAQNFKGGARQKQHTIIAQSAQEAAYNLALTGILARNARQRRSCNAEAPHSLSLPHLRPAPPRQSMTRLRTALMCECGKRGARIQSKNDDPAASTGDLCSLEGFAGGGQEKDDLTSIFCPRCGEIGKVRPVSDGT